MAEMTTTRHIPKKMSDERRRELSDELAQTIVDKERLEQHQQTMAKESKALIEIRKKRISELAETIAQGMEMVAVACRVEYDLTFNTAIIKRQDTGEILEQRAMTNDERVRLIESRHETPAGKKRNGG